MLAFNHEYEPYLCNGRLCLPEKTVNIMLKAGLSPQIAEVARRGMILEDPGRIAEITESIKQLLTKIDAQNWQFRGWQGDQSSKIT